MATESRRRLAFDEVLGDELDAIDRRRESVYKEVNHHKEPIEPGSKHIEDENSKDGEYQRLAFVRRNALRKHLVGLALSGGGIRSATFAVGVLQGLARLGLIKRIDYLSTVSGGGYAGSWLATWIRREGSVSNVEEQLAQGRVMNAKAERQILGHEDVVDEEPEPIYHLRAYSRFLAPRAGLLTADAWSVVAIYARNIIINLLMLLPAAMIVVLLVRALINLFILAVPDSFYDQNEWILVLVLFAIGSVYLFHGLSTNAGAVNDLRHAVGPHPPVDKARMLDNVVLPLLVATVLLPLSLMAIFWWLLPELIRLHGDWHSFALVKWLYPNIPGPPAPGQSEKFPPGFWEKSSPVWHHHGWSLLYTPEVLLSVGLAEISIFGWLCGWKRWKLIVFAVLIPLIFSLLSHLTHDELEGNSVPARLNEYLYYLVFPAVFGAVLLFAYIAGAWKVPALRNSFLLRSAVGSGMAGGVLLAAVVHLLYRFCSTRPDLLATFAPPACLLVLVATTVFHVAQLGHHINEDEREWWAYFDAYLVIVALCWLATFGTVVYLPAGLYFLLHYIKDTYIRTGVLAGLISTWAGTTLAGILAGKSRQTGSGQANVSLETIAAIAPPVFLVGLFTLLSVLASEIIYPIPQTLSVHEYFGVLDAAPLVGIMILAFGLGVFFKVVSRFVDVNLFSLNAMYANRLVRCYLGASRKMPRWSKRWGRNGDRREGGGAPTNVGSYPSDTPEPSRRANPVTGFDSKDDVPLASFQIGKVGDDTGYRGPQLLINTSLNLVATEDLAWTDRKSESFVLSPSHCGSKGTGYAQVIPREVDKDLTIGRAIAVSGAAVDPNMNYHQSAALTAFLTIFNARLGYWIENPRPPKPAKKKKRRPPGVEESPKPWTGKSPLYGMLLVSELLGGTDSKGEYVHLTDGGHFENTGVYELVRRRCRYIIACDANTDRTASDENLSNLVRLVRIDFGIRIEIDTSPLQLDGDDSRLCRSHVVIGSVRYDDVDNGQSPGVLVYIRTSMTGDEPPDIRNYATVNREFPYTTSANQFFDEAQFESYRALGDHVARVVFEDAKADAERTAKLWSESDYDTEFRHGNNRLFAALRRRWAESMPGQDVRFLESAREYIEIQKMLRRDPALRDLSFQVYPELGSGSDAVPEPEEGATTAARPSATLDGRRVELYAVAQMLQAIENAWIGLDLKSHPAEPISHGWWSIFRRWTATEAFHRNWPILRPEFSTEFVRFVETRLGLVPAMPEVVPWFGDRISEAERTSLIAEFDREWPKATFSEDTPAEDKEGSLKLSLSEMIQRAAQILDTNKVKAKAVWGILQEPKPRSEDGPKAGECRGIVLVFEGPSLYPRAETIDKPDHEFLIWVRRPHRGLGLGSYAMEKTLETIEHELEVLNLAKVRLHARYPRVVDDDVRSMWKRFYSLYDFETEPGAPSEGDISICLHRYLELRRS
jgi:hypothetical protein